MFILVEVCPHNPVGFGGIITNGKIWFMRNSLFLLIIFFAVGFFSCNTFQKEISPIRVHEIFNNGWKFHLGDQVGAHDPAFNDLTWENLNLPHDWSITEPYIPNNPGGHGTSFMIGGIGWYRKTFFIPHEFSGKRVEITFDGVYQNSTVWINGHKLGTRPFGYITFKYDLTPYLIPGGENIIAVRVDNSHQPNSRWYSGSGIYRNVWLTATSPAYIDPWGLFITTPETSRETSLVRVETTIKNETAQNVNYNLVARIITPSGKEVASVSTPVSINQNNMAQLVQEIRVDNPMLWSVATPELYTLHLEIQEGNKVIDDYSSRFGIRYFSFDNQRGFLLNDEQVKIKGVCIHHDLGALGAAVNTRALERQLQILKSMGVNGIRTSHNPPAPELLQLCDRMGFIVMNETFDEWKMRKTRFGYAEFWDEWHEQDLHDHIVRDRNHPSVFIWSIGNEILEQWHPQGEEMAKKLASLVRKLDPTRPITAGNNDPAPHNSLIRSGALDLIGYNYKHETFANFPTVFPGKTFIAAETTSALATRGHYDMPSDSVRIWPIRWDLKFTDGNPDNSCSAYDNCRTPWGSTHQDSWKVIKKHDFLTGMYIWTGFDYLGEPTPYEWPSRSSYFGIVDLAGFPKDAYYMYKSEWTNDTVLHIFPHWNWQQGQTIDVVAYYNNATDVELFLNNVSLGAKSKQGEDVSVMWRVPFAPGTLEAVSRSNGKEIKTTRINTAGPPAQMQVTADRTHLTANGEDLSFITINIIDEKGNLVPDAGNLVTVSLEGEATIAGVDNGNQTSHHDFKGNTINAFNGKCLVIVKSGTSPGQIRVRLTSDGLPDQVLNLVSAKK